MLWTKGFFSPQEKKRLLPFEFDIRCKAATSWFWSYFQDWNQQLFKGTFSYHSPAAIHLDLRSVDGEVGSVARSFPGKGLQDGMRIMLNLANRPTFMVRLESGPLQNRCISNWSLFFLSALGLIHLFENKMDVPIHRSYYEHFGCVVETRRHDSVHCTVKACIIRPKKKASGQHQDVSGDGQTHLDRATGQSGKKEADSTFVPIADLTSFRMTTSHKQTFQVNVGQILRWLRCRSCQKH